MFNNFIREDKLELTGVNSRIDNIEEEQLSLSDNIGNLQAQIDGEVSSYFMEGTPRNDYRPSSEWTDDTLKQRHLGDTYTNILPYEIDLAALDKDNKLFWFEKGSVQGNTGDSFDDMLVDNENHYRTKCLLTKDNLEGGSIDFFMVNSISDSVSNDFNISIYYFNNNNQCVGTASGYSNGTENGFELLIDTTYHYAIIVFEVSDITDIRLQCSSNNKYINPDAGKSYRWCNYDDEDNTTFHWHPIADSDAIRALQKVDDLSKSFQIAIDTAIEDLSKDFQTEIDNIEIGGRNLLTGSKTGKGWSQYTSFEDGIFYSENNTNGKKEKYIYSPKNLKLSKGTYTLSFDFKTEDFEAYTGTRNIGFQLFFIDGDYNPAIDRRIQYNELSTDWKHYIWTFDISEDCDGSGYIRFDNDGNSSFTNPTKLWIKNAKLEKGNKATDYTPAPEDYMNAIAESEDNMTEALEASVATINDSIETLQKQIDENINVNANIINIIYPVGSIYISVSEINPEILFGFGKWEQIKDVFLLSAGDSYKCGDKGGEYEHALTHEELPKLEGEIIMHHASVGTNIAGAEGCFSGDSIVQGKYRQGGTLLDSDTISIGKINYTNSGENKPHNNMPPYLAVYMWKRIL